MSFSASEASDGDAAAWDEHVESSSHTNPLHRFDALDVLADATDAALHRLIAYKGEEPVGVLPLFSVSRFGFDAVFAAPLGLELQMGPALLDADDLTQRKRERRNQRFVEVCVDWIDDRLDPDYVRLGFDDRYTDVRPLVRRGWNVTPSYTYVLDLSPGKRGLLDAFSREARSNVYDYYDAAGCVVREGSVGDVEWVLSETRSRFEAQGREYWLDDPATLAELYRVLPDGAMRPYVCRVDGEVCGGIVVLSDDTTTYRWLGAATPDVDRPVNDWIDWHVVSRAVDRDSDRYNLVGAMERRLCRYKAKFDPTPTPVFEAERTNWRSRAAKATFERLPAGVRSAVRP